jgi:hypothetical protein
VGNTAVILQPLPSFGDRLFLFRRNWFVVDRSGGDSEGDGLEHGFEQADDGGQLRWWQSVDQFVGMLFAPP